MPDVLEGIDEDLAQITEPLIARRERLIEHRQSLVEQTKNADDLLRRINNALRPLRPDIFEEERSAKQSKPSKQRGNLSHIGKRRSNGTATGHGISFEACEPYVKEILKQTKGKTDVPVTQRGIYNEIEGGEQTKASASFRYLRSIGFLRKGGFDAAGRREQWFLDKPDAYEEELKAIEEASEDA